jgi:hypothetical protein
MQLRAAIRTLRKQLTDLDRTIEHFESLAEKQLETRYRASRRSHEELIEIPPAHDNPELPEELRDWSSQVA